MIYSRLSSVFPATATPPNAPQRIVLIKPCCIGDVVMATATLAALRTHYPAAHITWAVGGWSRQVAELWTPQIDILDTGPAANPAASLGGFVRLVSQLRAGRFDLAVSLSRSPLMSAAVWLSGVPCRAGLDSDGRGFGYNLRAPLDPAARRHEVEIYLDVVRRLGADVTGVCPHVPLPDDIDLPPIEGQYIIVNPSGGSNPGAQMDAKRYPPHWLAQIVNQIAPALGVEQVLIVAGPGDRRLAHQVGANLHRTVQATPFVGTLDFAQIATLAARSRLYIGNDTGLTHLAAAAGGRVAMLLGPTDPQRYRAYSPDALALWRERDLPPGGFADGPPPDWDWTQHGIPPEDAARQILAAFA